MGRDELHDENLQLIDVLDVSPRSSVEPRDDQNDDGTHLTCRRIIWFIATADLHALLVLTTREAQTDWVGLSTMAHHKINKVNVFAYKSEALQL